MDANLKFKAENVGYFSIVLVFANIAMASKKFTNLKSEKKFIVKKLVCELRFFHISYS